MCHWYHVCPMKRFYDQGLLDRYWVENYCFGDNKRCVRYQLEKRGEYHPDNMLPDGTIDNHLARF